MNLNYLQLTVIIKHLKDFLKIFKIYCCHDFSYYLFVNFKTNFKFLQCKDFSLINDSYRLNRF